MYVDATGCARREDERICRTSAPQPRYAASRTSFRHARFTVLPLPYIFDVRCAVLNSSLCHKLCLTSRPLLPTARASLRRQPTLRRCHAPSGPHGPGPSVFRHVLPDTRSRCIVTWFSRRTDAVTSRLPFTCHMADDAYALG